jgi:hypothetical protein
MPRRECLPSIRTRFCGDSSVAPSGVRRTSVQPRKRRCRLPRRPPAPTTASLFPSIRRAPARARKSMEAPPTGRRRPSTEVRDRVFFALPRKRRPSRRPRRQAQAQGKPSPPRRRQREQPRREQHRSVRNAPCGRAAPIPKPSRPQPPRSTVEAKANRTKSRRSELGQEPGRTARGATGNCTATCVDAGCYTPLGPEPTGDGFSSNRSARRIPVPRFWALFGPRKERCSAFSGHLNASRPTRRNGARGCETRRSPAPGHFLKNRATGFL